MINKGFEYAIGLSGLPQLPLGDSYHVCLYNPADGSEYEGVETNDAPEGLGGDVHYMWSSDLTATMTEGQVDLRVFDLAKKVLFKQERFETVVNPHIESCEEG